MSMSQFWTRNSVGIAAVVGIVALMAIADRTEADVPPMIDSIGISAASIDIESTRRLKCSPV